mgnify:CR=1 FL=1
MLLLLGFAYRPFERQKHRRPGIRYVRLVRERHVNLRGRAGPRQREREAKSRVIEKKPPKAAINLGTDVDAPWGEKIETSRKDNHQNA